MDPDANLQEQLKLAQNFQQDWDSNVPLDPTDCLRLAELVIALDEWITKGGFLPAAWQKGRAA